MQIGGQKHNVTVTFRKPVLNTQKSDRCFSALNKRIRLQSDMESLQCCNRILT